MGYSTFLTYSLGCRVNQAEIEGIANDLVAKGFSPWFRPLKFPNYPKFPNLILLNTCVVTQKAERESRKSIRHFRRLYPKSFLVVMGCGVDAKQKMKINLPQANFLISNEEKPSAVNLILQNLKTPRMVALSLPKGLLRGEQSNAFAQSGRALLKIQDGCNRFCAFCIVLYLRGKPKSIAPAQIVKAIKRLSNEAIKEIILTGINLSLYGKDLEPKTNLVELLREILKETKVSRISLSSLTPEIITEDFANLYIDDWKNNKGRLSRYWHLALQSGSPAVLERMGRKTNLKKLLKTVQYIEQRLPKFAIRADILIGFPNETEKEFQESLQYIKQAKISFAHIFPFSKRPGTIAEKMITQKIWQDLPEKIKKERVKRIMAAAEAVRREEAKKLIGKILPCLFIRKLKNGVWETLADNSWKVLVKGKGTKGEICPIKICGITEDYLLGEILAKPVYF